ncbi:hypothetical protein GCM10025865_26410 [Paraoerskovia sediminicola]|uniref:DUF4192 domain-containing protein n=1 Tax=Paraoerskovia sediminicola TaxID=1138587 RepID=A0ABN6XEJ2_9CELL|nr:hypothetical protein GCM10025865_26410 [Paraoerskovia sediminicola]
MSYVPYRLGFEPRDSLVTVSVREGRRVGLVARVDLDDLLGRDGERLARLLAGHHVTDGASRVVLVGYSDRADDVAAAAEALTAALGSAPGAQETWVVSSRGYRELGCADGDCCPPEGRPLTDLQSTEISATMVLEGAAVAPSRAESFRIPTASTDRRRSALRAGRRWASRDGAPTAGPAGAAATDGTAGARWRTAGYETWCAAVAGARHGSHVARDGTSDADAAVLAAPVAGRLAVALTCVPVRDAVLLSLVPGTGDLARETARGATRGTLDAGTAAAMAAIVDPARGVPPDQRVVRPAVAVLTDVVAHATGTARVAPLTLLALLAWWCGDGGQANLRLEEALALDPEHRLALLLESALAAGVPPGWVRAQQ